MMNLLVQAVTRTTKEKNKDLTILINQLNHSVALMSLLILVITRYRSRKCATEQIECKKKLE